MLGFHASAAGHAAHAFEEFGHLGVVAEEVVDLLGGGAGADGDALAAAVDDAWQLLIVPTSLATGVVDFGGGGGCGPAAIAADDQDRSIREQSCRV